MELDWPVCVRAMSQMMPCTSSEPNALSLIIARSWRLDDLPVGSHRLGLPVLQRVRMIKSGCIVATRALEARRGPASAAPRLK